MRLRNGALLFLISLLIGCAGILTSCRHGSGPDIEVCVWNGDGTSECCLPGEDEICLTKNQSELENYVGTNADDFSRLLNWCNENESVHN